MVVAEAFHKPFTVSSNFARVWAPEVAAAASLGLLTTEIGGMFGNRWRVTVAGMERA